MKYILSTSPSGALEISTHPQFTGSTGLVLPASQTVIGQIPSTRTLGTLFSHMDPAPMSDGVEVHVGSKRYEYISGVICDADTFADASAVSVSGEVRLRNSNPHDIGVTW
jgi:hypothetical protein